MSDLPTYSIRNRNAEGMCGHPKCDQPKPLGGPFCSRCEGWMNSKRNGNCPCRSEQETAPMSLIVTDANGRKYKPTGHFREPENGEPYWSVTSQSVCKYNAAVGYTGDHPFGAMAIILEAVPVEYVAHVRLTEDAFRFYKSAADRGDDGTTAAGRKLIEAIRMGSYDEVPE